MEYSPLLSVMRVELRGGRSFWVVSGRRSLPWIVPVIGIDDDVDAFTKSIGDERLHPLMMEARGQ